GWMAPLVDLSANIASALIAVDRLDRDAAAAALNTVESQVSRERSWAPFVTYAHARYELYWGDHRSALERIERTRAFTGEQHRNAGIEPRLDAVKANLLLALERPHEAQIVLTQREGSPHVLAVAARLALMSGSRGSSREIAVTGLAFSELDPRSQIDLLVVAAIAEESASTARRHLQQAIATSIRTRTLTPFALIDRSALLRVSEAVLTTTNQDWVRTVLSSAPEPLPAAAEIVDLTNTEQRVLQLLADGASNPQIAQALFISENTVKFHLKNLYRKLGAPSRADAVIKGRELRLVRPVT
ncbi:response regulator transcription factor, partial [Microbacterium sp. AGC62]